MEPGRRAEHDSEKVLQFPRDPVEAFAEDQADPGHEQPNSGTGLPAFFEKQETEGGIDGVKETCGENQNNGARDQAFAQRDRSVLVVVDFENSVRGEPLLPVCLPRGECQAQHREGRGSVADRPDPGQDQRGPGQPTVEREGLEEASFGESPLESSL